MEINVRIPQKPKSSDSHDGGSMSCTLLPISTKQLMLYLYPGLHIVPSSCRKRYSEGDGIAFGQQLRPMSKPIRKLDLQV